MGKGIDSENRLLLDNLHRRFAGPFSVSEAQGVINRDIKHVRRLLAHLVSQGWLVRIRRGSYRTVPLGATSPSQWREDPWLVAAHTFAPCYLAGWTACEHWGLTEQLFRDIVVVTSRRVRNREEIIQDTRYLVQVRKAGSFFGLRKIWRNQQPVFASDPSRTVVDILDSPAMAGGIRATAGALRNYFASEHRNDSLIADYASKLGNRTVFKRLGYFTEMMKPGAGALLETCRANMSRGVSLLDPSGPNEGSIIKRWWLRINVAATMEDDAP